MLDFGLSENRSSFLPQHPPSKIPYISNAGTHVPDYRSSHNRRQQFSRSQPWKPKTCHTLTQLLRRFAASHFTSNFGTVEDFLNKYESYYSGMVVFGHVFTKGFERLFFFFTTPPKTKGIRVSCKEGNWSFLSIVNFRENLKAPTVMTSRV